MSITLRRNENFEKLDKEFKEKFINGVNFLAHEELEFSYDIDSKFLRAEEISVIKERCANDFWFFMKYVAKKPENGMLEVSKGEPMYINKANAAAIHLSLNNINNYTNAVRQTMSSWTRALFILWKILFSTYNIRINLLSPRESNSRMIIDRVLILNSLLPNYIQRDKEFIKSKLYIVPNPKNFNQADCIGRGACGNILYIEDFEHIDFIDIMYPRFKIISECGMLIMSHSSVGEYNSKSKLTADKLIKNACKWEDLMYNLKLKRENNNMMYIKYDYTEIVDNPENYIRIMRLDLNNNIDAINREILLIRDIQDGESNV